MKTLPIIRCYRPYFKTCTSNINKILVDGSEKKIMNFLKNKDIKSYNNTYSYIINSRPDIFYKKEYNTFLYKIFKYNLTQHIFQSESMELEDDNFSIIRPEILNILFDILEEQDKISLVKMLKTSSMIQHISKLYYSNYESELFGDIERWKKYNFPYISNKLLTFLIDEGDFDHFWMYDFENFNKLQELHKKIDKQRFLNSRML